jgi:nicotinate phosphoribosyltransferase
VAREDASGTLVPVAKKSTEKLSVGGRKYALRRRSASGRAEAEVIGIGEPPSDDGDDRSLLVPLVEHGRRVHHDSLDAARKRHRAAFAELPDDARKLSRGEPVIETVFAASP